MYKMKQLNDDGLFLTADEAAQALQVSLGTLYSYVSRKLIRSEQVEGSRRRLYWKADIDKICGKKPAVAPAAVSAQLATETSITLITSRGLYFRGQDVVGLSESESLESVAALLWEADETELFAAAPPDAPEAWRKLKDLNIISTSERAFALFPLLERSQPRSYDLTQRGFRRTGADALRWYAALVGDAAQAPREPIHCFLAKALGAPEGFDDIIRRLLVLSADHEFDPVTYAVRAVANVGVTPYHAVMAGLIASRGQRFMAERYGATVRLLDEICASQDGSEPVVERLRNGESLPGFASLGDHEDPRTVAMLNALERVLDGHQGFNRLLKAEATAREVAQKTMTFILPAIFVGHFLGMRGEELGISSVGRVAGWIAHAMEQFHGSVLVRPRSVYKGILPNHDQ